jgi:biotin synthase
MISLLSLTDENDMETLFREAYAVKERFVGRKTYFRGLIELSNICERDCLYCGIRKSGGSERYIIPKTDVIALAQWAYDNRYGSVTIQAGERVDAWFTEYVTGLIKAIKLIGDGGLGITLSLGEQTAETYKKWFDAGAHRYLLRIETSNETLYKKIHAGSSYAQRLECIEALKKAGYQVGTGIMIGLPHQTVGDLADDILFFGRIGAGMIGMGPYVVAKGTPLGDEAVKMGFDDGEAKQRRFILALKMIAVTRIYLRNVNIASASALHALNPEGRQKALRAGANILMPVLTLPEHKKRYTLYDGKPGLDDDAVLIKDSLVKIVGEAGDTVGFGEWGDSPRYADMKKDG